jgi:hypothetical protein
VALRCEQPARATLRVAVDGGWTSLRESVRPCGVVADLASLLESAPVLHAEAGGRCAVEIALPLPPAGIAASGPRPPRARQGGANA